jgi:signal peptide peptidase SppA
MNFIKHYPRIEQELYHRPWMVLPNIHKTLCDTFKAHIEGTKMEMPDMPMDEEKEEVSTETAAPSVAVINVEGIIGKRLGMLEQCMGGCDIDGIHAAIDEIEADESITTAVFYFNTPGGTVTGVPEISERIAELGKKKNTIAYVDILCASAGYYMASQCNAIYSAPSADLGSVGVYAMYTDETRYLENLGVKVNCISAGKYKVAGASFRPMSDEERAMFQADVDKIYTAFKSAVTSKRDIEDEDLQGQVFSGDDVVNKGFADGHLNSLGELMQMISGQTS